MSKYISVTDTAKLVRQALKANFPKTTFSVKSKSYSGGASITVKWVDGETTGEVDPVIRQFAGADFDGMQDLKTYHSSILDGDEVVHFGADFVFSSRETSISFRMRIAKVVSAYFDVPVPAMNRYNWFERTNIYPMHGREELVEVISQVMGYTNADDETLHAGQFSYLPNWVEAIWAAAHNSSDPSLYPELRDGAHYTPEGGVIISAELLNELVAEGSAEVVELSPEMARIATPDEGLETLDETEVEDTTPCVKVSAETLQPISKPDALRERLANVTVDHLSPLEALTLLYELKRLV